MDLGFEDTVEQEKYEALYTNCTALLFLLLNKA